jgi:hypothetical protein
MLHCANGRYVVASMCRGPGGCGKPSLYGTVECDARVANAGDPCVVLGGSACSPDRKTLLRCSAPGGYKMHVSCRIANTVFTETRSCPRDCSVTHTPEGNGARISVVCR